MLTISSHSSQGIKLKSDQRDKYLRPFLSIRSGQLPACLIQQTAKPINNNSSPASQMIKALSENTAEQLCAQQVITNLPDIIKQLIDNSIDAKATYIKIRLEEYGKKTIEVIDNGMGIDNFDFLGKKGSTSKNKGNDRFDYLGFRGEAVHSIARVSGNMTIESKSSRDGFRRKFNVTSLICEQFKQERLCHGQFNFKLPNREGSRNTGTKVTIEGIFQTLPVRQIELISKHKQFLKKTNELIKQFCLIYPEVQFIFLNTREGREEVIIETVSHHEFTRKSWLERIKELDERIGNNLVYISGGLFEGFVLNKIESGSGYANTFIKKNYHYLFVNRRPVDVQPALLAVLNEIYRKYNSGTRYAFVLNLKLEHQQIDVNLSPNKREVFIRKTALEGIVEQLRREIGLQVGDEVPVLASFQERKSKGSQSAVLGEAREELNEKNSKSPFVSNRAQNAKPENENIDRNRQVQQIGSNKKTQLSAVSEQFRRANLQPEQQKRGLILNKPIKPSTDLPQLPKISINFAQLKERLNSKMALPSTVRRPTFNEIEPPNSEVIELHPHPIPDGELETLRRENQEKRVRQEQQDAVRREAFLKQIKLEAVQSELLKPANQKSHANIQSYKLAGSKKKREKPSDSGSAQRQAKEWRSDSPKDSASVASSKSKLQRQRGNLMEQQINQRVQGQDTVEHIDSEEGKPDQNLGRPQYTPKHDMELQARIKSKLKVDMSQIFVRFNQKTETQDQSRQTVTVEPPQQIQFHPSNASSQIVQDAVPVAPSQSSEIPSQTIQSSQQQSLSQFAVKNLKKQHFRLFEVIGQFNLGFILCLFNDRCYLVDQHASSEKQYYENFLNTVRLESINNFEEREITTIEVDQIEEVKPLLSEAGFYYEIIDRTYLKLIRCPIFQDKKLGMDYFMSIVQEKKELHKIKKFIDMCALKACRTAVMIGSVLTKRDMVQLVHNLSDLQSPWNCPHGRPTVIELGLERTFKKQVKREAVYDL